MSRRWRYPRARRGEFWDYPKPVVTPAAPDTAFLQLIQAGRHRTYLTRRGDFQAVPVAQTSPVAPFTRQARRYGALARRGDFFTVPVALTVPAPQIGRQARRYGLVARRGDYQWVPPAVVAQAGPGPWIQPPYRWPIRRGMLCRRGEIFFVPLVGLAPAAPTTPPSFITARRHRTGPPRRGRYHVPVPPRYDVPPQWRRPRCPQPQIRQREHFIEPPWPFIPPQPSVWRPDLVRARRRPPALPYLRRIHWHQPPWPQIGPPPIIDANGRVVVTQTVVSTVDATSGAGGMAGVDQTSASFVSGSSAAGGATSVDPTSDGRAEVG